MINGYSQSKRVDINGKVLDPAESLKLRNHSPDGFNWGYPGSGPSQLALALLLHFTNKDFALRNYMEFKDMVIAKLPPTSFSLPGTQVKQWCKERGWK